MAQQQVAKVSWWYERLADWMISNPDKDIKDAAPVFNCHIQTLYIIKNSDSFKRYFTERSKAVSSGVDGEMVQSMTGLQEKTAALAEASLDILNEKMRAQGANMPVQSVLAVADMALKKLGYGSQHQVAPAPAVNVQFNVVNGEMLERARQKLEEARGKPIPVLSPPRPVGSQEGRLAEGPQEEMHLPATVDAA